MARRNVFLVFTIGLFTGVLGMIALSGGHAFPGAMAQVQKDDPAQPSAVQLYRFQVAPWANPNGYGAYVLDTATGHLWRTQDQWTLQRVWYQREQ